MTFGYGIQKMIEERNGEIPEFIEDLGPAGAGPDEHVYVYRFSSDGEEVAETNADPLSHDQVGELRGIIWEMKKRAALDGPGTSVGEERAARKVAACAAAAGGGGETIEEEGR